MMRAVSSAIWRSSISASRCSVVSIRRQTPPPVTTPSSAIDEHRRHHVDLGIFFAQELDRRGFGGHHFALGGCGAVIEYAARRQDHGAGANRRYGPRPALA